MINARFKQTCLSTFVFFIIAVAGLINPFSLYADTLDAASTPTKPVFDPCPSNGLTVKEKTYNLQGDCLITGDINLSGTAALNMMNGMLMVRGNVVLKDRAALAVANGGFVFPQTNYSQYSISLHNKSRLTLTNAGFITNGTGSNNFSMALDAYDSSTVTFKNSKLDTSNGSWLLGNFKDTSTLRMSNAIDLPTEIYPSDAATIAITKSDFASIWLDFVAGSAGEVDLPVLDKKGRFSFTFGDSPGFDYSIKMVSSKTRLGLNSYPRSTMIINGNGGNGSAEEDANIVIGYYVENNTRPVAINGLRVGENISRKFTDMGRRLILNHVNLNPFAWQVYVNESNENPVNISNSFINELVLGANGRANISNSVLQLAVTAAAGPGSLMNINGSQIWSQSLLAQNGGMISINNSQLHGNFISASGKKSVITMSNVGDARNGARSQNCTPINGFPPNDNGVPLCNPYNPLNACSKIQATNGGTVSSSPRKLECPK